MCGECEMNWPYGDSNDHDQPTPQSQFQSQKISYRLISICFDCEMILIFFVVFFPLFSASRETERLGARKKNFNKNPIDNDADDETGLCSFERNQKFLFH